MSVSDSDRRLVKIAQAAGYLGVSDSVVRLWISKGHFPVYKVDGQRAALVDLNEVEAATKRLTRRKYGNQAQVVHLAKPKRRPVVITEDGQQ